jgi:hypothetical protein
VQIGLDELPRSALESQPLSLPFNPCGRMSGTAVVRPLA